MIIEEKGEVTHSSMSAFDETSTCGYGFGGQIFQT